MITRREFLDAIGGRRDGARPAELRQKAMPRFLAPMIASILRLSV